MNRSHSSRFGIIFLVALAGCGGSGLSTGAGDSGGPRATHGGALIELPNRAGFVELAVEADDASAKSPKARGKVVAYFLNPDGSGPTNPEPSDVKFTDEAGKTLALLAKAAGASEGARFESGPVQYAIGDISGKIVAKLGTETVSLESRPR